MNDCYNFFCNNGDGRNKNFGYDMEMMGLEGFFSIMEVFCMLFSIG